MKITQHGAIRSQQRGIPPLVIDWLQAYGEETHDHHGGLILHFTNRSRRRLERDIGREPVRRMSEYLNCKAVIGVDHEVITVGKRFKRIPRQ